MFNFDELKKKMQEQYDEMSKTVLKPNIMLIGATGAGKSSLVNLCFGQDLASVGTGRPVTKGIHKHELEDVPVVLYDSEGYEVGSEKHSEFIDNIVKLIDSEKSPEERIHLVWYCIPASGHRIVDFDKRAIKRLSEVCKSVAVVFTKSDLVTDEEAEKLTSALAEIVPGVPSFQTSTENLPEVGHIELDKLLQWSSEKLPEAFRAAFVRAQRTNLELKRSEVWKIIALHSGGAAAASAIPVPFVDFPVALGNLTWMFNRIINLYDMGNVLDGRKLIGEFGAGTLARMFSGWAVGELAKFIPVAGEVLAAAVDAAITGASGYALSEICYRVSILALEGKQDSIKSLMDNLSSLFDDLFKNAKKERPWERTND